MSRLSRSESLMPRNWKVRLEAVAAVLKAQITAAPAVAVVKSEVD